MTAASPGAVAVFRLVGPEAVAIANRAFRPNAGAPLDASLVGQLRFGRIGDPLGDEVVAVVLPADPPAVEIHGHGGTALVALVAETLRDAGAVIDPKTIAARRGRPSLEALRSLPSAATLRVAEFLLGQANGLLDEELLGIAALIGMGSVEVAGRHLDALLDRGSSGVAFVHGTRLALAGRPNVGKSSLLNALAGFERAIVSPSPGTTRDALACRLAFDGIPVEVLDTAGLRETEEAIEGIGIEIAARLHQTADLVVLVLDASMPWTAEDAQLVDRYPTALRVANKIDRPAEWEPGQVGALAISAASGEGLDRLIAELGRRLLPDPPRADQPTPFLQEQLAEISDIQAELRAGHRSEALDRLRDWLDAPRADPWLIP